MFKRNNLSPVHGTIVNLDLDFFRKIKVITIPRSYLQSYMYFTVLWKNTQQLCRMILQKYTFSSEGVNDLRRRDL